MRIELTDVGATLDVQPGVLTGTDPESGEHHDGPHLVLLDGGADPIATVTGNAADVDTWLWRRRGRDGIDVAGDSTTLAAFTAATSPPLD